MIIIFSSVVLAIAGFFVTTNGHPIAGRALLIIAILLLVIKNLMIKKEA